VLHKSTTPSCVNPTKENVLLREACVAR